VHSFEPLVPVLVGLLQRHVQVAVRLLGSQVDDIEFGVDVDEFSVLVDDGKSRDSPVDEFSKGFDDWRGVVSHLDVVVRTDLQVANRTREIRRRRQIVDIEV